MELGILLIDFREIFWYKGYMQKAVKSIMLVMLVCLISSLLILAEFAINPVLCFKSDGTSDLEYALLDFNCDCNPPEHKHNLNCTSAKKQKHPDMPQIAGSCCFDLLLPSYFFKINTSSNITGLKILDLEHIYFTSAEVNLILRKNLYTRYYRLYPIFKFLLAGTYNFSKIKILC